MARNAQNLHDDAKNAIRHIGARALPYAIQCCRARNDSSQEDSDDWFRGKKLFGVEVEDLYLSFRPRHVISGNDLHERSGAIFRILGPGAKSAIPTLINLPGDQDAGVARTAAGDLYDVGPDVVAPLISALTNRNAQIRGYAASVFELPWREATSAIPALSLCLSDPDSKVRASAACALGILATNGPPTVVSALLDALGRETNLLGTLSLIGALGKCGTNAQSAVPALKHLAQSQPIGNFSHYCPDIERGERGNSQCLWAFGA